jgi:hypothetical protein
MENHGRIILTGENLKLGEKPVPVPFFYHKSYID